MLKIFKYLRKIDYLFILFIITFVVIQVWLELTMPDYTQKLTTLVSEVIQNNKLKEMGLTDELKEISMNDVWFNGGMMILCAFGAMISAFVCGFFSSRVASSLSKNLRDNLFLKVNGFSQKEINQFSTPSLITRTTNDVVQIQNFFAMGLQLMLRAPIMAIWAVFKITFTNVKWTLAAIIAVSVIIIFATLIMAFGISKFRKIQKLTDDLNDKTRENISGVRVIRAFNATDYQTKKFEDVNNKTYKNNMQVSILTSFMNPVMMLVMNGLTLSIYWIGAFLIKESPENASVLLGEMTAFASYSMQIVMSFMMLVFLFIILPRTVVSAKRINEVLDKDTSITDGNYIDDANLNDGVSIEFKNVSFSYGDEDKYSLIDLNFEIEKGKTTAIIGPTGSGKTTIVNLISRLYDATKGEILVNGINVKDYKINDLESKIAVASQKAMMLKGTIKDNICYGDDSNKTEEEKEESLNKAIRVSQSNFIFDDSLGTAKEVSQGGTNFSGGQKQRLSIARTLYKDSSVMIFDDTFSALDFKTDMLVRKGINDEYKNKTVIIIAQRIGTVKNADKIIVLNDGRIDSIGTHDELIKNSELYKDIALSQLEKEEL